MANVQFPLLSDDVREWANSLVSVLQQAVDAGDIVPTSGLTLYDTQGRPIVDPNGVYAYDALGNNPIAPDIVQIDTAQLVDTAVTTNKIANLAVNNDKLAALSVDAAKLANSAVTATKIANLAVGTAAIQAAAVGTAQIANLAVTSALIADGAILTAKIGDLQVNTAKIANLAVTNAKIGNLAVDTGQIADLAVETLKINNQAVTIPSSAYTAGSTTTTSGTYSDLQSVTFTSTGAPVAVTFSMMGDSAVSSTLTHIRLIRDSTVLIEVPSLSQSDWTNTLWSFTITDTPASGSRTYKLQWKVTGSTPQAFGSRRSLFTIETKK